MRPCTTTPRRDERGSITLFTLIISIALLATAAVVIDAGYAMGDNRKAMTQAEQAARVGADALSESKLRSGITAVDRDRAIAAAQRYLAGVDATGTVRVNGGQVTVTVTREHETTMLSAVGVGTLPVKATATATSIDEDTGP